MNLRPILRYQLREYFKVFPFLYAIIYFFFFLTLYFKYVRHTGNSQLSGMEFETMAACFGVGIALFKSAFRFFSSCGISRRRLFCGMTAAVSVTAAAVSLLDVVNAAVFSNFINYQTFYAGLVQNQLKSGSVDFIMGEIHNGLPAYTAGFLLKNWLWCLLTDFALAMLGFLIGVLYYRMNKPVKILVSVGVPALCIIFLPLFDATVMHGAIGRFVSAAWAQWTNWGLNPGLDLLTRFLLVAVLASLIWLLLRKAELYR